MQKVIARFLNKKEQQIIERNNAGTGSFYHVGNSKVSCKHGLDALGNSARDVIVGDAERADLFNSYFQLSLND